MTLKNPWPAPAWPPVISTSTPTLGDPDDYENYEISEWLYLLIAAGLSVAAVAAAVALAMMVATGPVR